LKTTSTPKLFIYGTGSGLVGQQAELDYVQAQYNNMTTSCSGHSGHFGPEDEPYNFVRRIKEWVDDKGL